MGGNSDGPIERNRFAYLDRDTLVENIATAKIEMQKLADASKGEVAFHEKIAGFITDDVEAQGGAKIGHMLTCFSQTVKEMTPEQKLGIGTALVVYAEESANKNQKGGSWLRTLFVATAAAVVTAFCMSHNSEKAPSSTTPTSTWKPFDAPK